MPTILAESNSPVPDIKADVEAKAKEMAVRRLMDRLGTWWLNGGGMTCRQAAGTEMEEGR